MITLRWPRRHSGYAAIEAAIRWVVGEVGEKVERAVIAVRTNPLQWSGLNELLLARERQRALAGLVAELTQTVDRLERSNEELAGLARITAHDLAAPLRAVSGLIDLLPQADVSPDTRLTLDAIRSAIDRMQAMVAGTTGYVQVGSEEPRRALVDLNELVARARGVLQSEIEERGVSFAVEELPSVFGDEHQLERVFLNLISNALKYAGERPREISIYAWRACAAWQVSVADRGIGVNEADRERIFGLFTRGEVESGSGIGLAVCRRIVEYHGGAIWVEPNEPSGSIFRFTLPDKPTVARG